jgi:putative ATPase
MSEKNEKLPPLPQRMRPKSIDDMVGQSHLIGQGAPLRTFIENGVFPSIVF